MVILCVDDHAILLNDLVHNVRLAMPGAEVHGFPDAQATLTFAQERGCDVLFCEIELYHHSGIWLAEQLQQINPRVNIIFVTVCSEKEHARAVMRLRVSGYLTKPVARGKIAEELRNLRYDVKNKTVNATVS